MAPAGRLKAKIDRIKKTIETKGSSLDPARRRLLKKWLKRAQRARRIILAREAKAKVKAKSPAPAPAEAQGGGEAPPPPA